MANQIGAQHNYSDLSEATSPSLATCPQCQTKAVPRQITSTKKTLAAGKGTCPYCGHIYNRNTLLVRKVRNIALSGGNTITVNKATLQLAAAILPTYADKQGLTWSVANGTGQATIDQTGLVTPVTVPVVNPTAAPTLATATTGGSLAAATYYVRYTWKNANGETMVSPEASIVTTGATSTVTATIPALPAGVATAEVYIGTSAGTGTRQGSTATTSFVQSAVLAAGTAAPGSNTCATGIASNGTITAIALPQDGGAARGEQIITISNQV